jgi:hypothetical protein
MRTLIAAVVFLLVGSGTVDAACGTRGGPGYRHAGKCVGWDQLVSSCKCKTTTTCVREDADPEADRQLEQACQRTGGQRPPTS